MSAVCLCADRKIMSFYCEDLYGRKNKLVRFLLIVLLYVLRSFSSICVIISCMLLMIVNIREIRHMYWYSLPISEDFLRVSII